MSKKTELATVREQIKESGLKVGFIAGKIGVHPGTLSSYLTGKRSLGLAAKKSLFKVLSISEGPEEKAS